MFFSAQDAPLSPKFKRQSPRPTSSRSKKDAATDRRKTERTERTERAERKQKTSDSLVEAPSRPATVPKLPIGGVETRNHVEEAPGFVGHILELKFNYG